MVKTRSQRRKKDDILQRLCFKGVDFDMCTRGFCKWEIGKPKTITIDKEKRLEICFRGFHACLDLKDVFPYYNESKFLYRRENGEWSSNRFFLARHGKNVIFGDGKLVTDKLTLLEEIEMTKEWIDYAFTESPYKEVYLKNIRAIGHFILVREKESSEHFYSPTPLFDHIKNIYSANTVTTVDFFTQ
jgi:hypothetical protein